MGYFTKLALGFLGLSSAVYAGPLEPRQATGISQADFDTIFLYEQYAAAAYCARQWSDSASVLFRQPNAPLAVNCRGAPGGISNCPAVEAAGATATFKADK
jgi:hypothetical protein